MKNSATELTSEERELLEQLLEQEGIDSWQQNGIPRLGSERAPLSYAQQRMWFLQQVQAQESNIYHLATVLRIGGSLRVDVMERVLNEIVRRHEVLRTKIIEIDGVPEQHILEPRHMPLPFVDLSSIAQEQREATIDQHIAEQVNEPFDLTSGTLFRALAIRANATEHILIFVLHHIAADGWSMEVFAREMAELYDAFLTGRTPVLPELCIQYSDFAIWQKQWLAGTIMDEQLAFWKKQLVGLPNLELPMARQCGATATHRASEQYFTISQNTVEALSRFSEAEGATLFITLLAAFQLLLHRYSGQTDIAVGSPIAGRTREETEFLLGLFVNTLVMRTDLSGNPTFRELVQRVRDTALDAYTNQDVPFEKLVEELQPRRDPGRSPLFQVLLVLQNTPPIQWTLSRLDVKEQHAPLKAEEFDIRLELVARERGLSGILAYRTDLLGDVFMRRMASHFQVLLESIVSNPDLPVSQLRLLTVGESKQILEDWNRTDEDYPKGKCIHHLFAEQAEKSPEAIALQHNGKQVTYRELDQSTNQLAQFLRASGVGPEVRVGVCLDRSMEMVVALLGILKAGGAYVPLDPSYPQDRLQFMLEDSGVEVLLTENKLVQKLQQTKAVRVCLDSQADEIQQHQAVPLATSTTSENAAYVIYTSGSTGRPKGTIIEHHSAATLLFWARQTYSDDQLSGVLASTSICFDLSVFELFVPLSWGGRIILVKDALELATLEDALKVRLINTVPSAITELLRLQAVPSSVDCVNLAGEPLKRRLADDIYRNTNARKVYNLYGPTEDTTYSTYALIAQGDDQEVTIGRPLPNTKMYVLDRELQPVPAGIPGELYISGDGLARGYLDRPDFTAQKFLPNPFGSKPGERLYHTGDLARWNEAGNLEFLGRMDNQVKIRGFRIELGEVEAAIESVHGIKQAVVGVWEHNGDKKIAAHYVGSPTPEQTQEQLKQRLPAYMIPAVFLQVPQMPLTPSGKVDRKRLPQPDMDAVQAERVYTQPTTPAEELLANIWADLLKIKRVGLDDNFFRLGGHSLLATRVISRIREVLQVEVPVRTLFESPVLANFSAAVIAREPRPGQVEKIATIFKKVQAKAAR